jgi:ketosteroid isomerase-like protein
MLSPTPLILITQLIQARNHGDIETAVALFETNATLVVSPGNVVQGEEALRASLIQYKSLNANFEATHSFVEAGDLALHCSHWSLIGIDPAGNAIKITSSSADVLRRQPDGNWRVALDNPWGTSLATPLPTATSNCSENYES